MKLKENMSVELNEKISQTDSALKAHWFSFVLLLSIGHIYAFCMILKPIIFLNSINHLALIMKVQCFL
jgi:hypothetical protein